MNQQINPTTVYLHAIVGTWSTQANIVQLKKKEVTEPAMVCTIKNQ
jgi:hypothetical protein